MRNRTKKKSSSKFKVRKSQRSTLRSGPNYDQLETRNLLATFTVNTAIDSVANDGLLSLREAIMAADTNTAVGDAAAGDAQGDVIRFDSSIAGQTITLQNGELAISDDLAIYGGNQNVSIDANSGSRIFNVNTSEQVVIRDLDLTHGSTIDTGGAVLSTGIGRTVINGVDITSSEAFGMGGGAIATANGQLLVLNSNLVGNSAEGASGSGGGLLINSGDVRVSSSTFASNVANRAGGGIEIIDGQLNFIGSVLGGASVSQGNIAGPAGTAAPGNGGGLHVTGMSGTRVFVSGSSVQNNFAASEGGGLWNQSGSTLSVRNSELFDNIAAGADADNGGGGLFNNGGTLYVTNAMIDGNLANGAAGSGGGLLSTGGSVVISDSTISGNVANRAGGGIEIINGSLLFADSQLGGASVGDGNVAGPAGSAAPGNGGGLHVSGSAGTYVALMDSDVQNNFAAREGGGLWNQVGSTLLVQGTTVSDNVAAGDAADDGGGGIFNNGGDLQIFDSAITANIATGASGSGGGIFSTNGNVYVDSTQISQNVANRAGGGIEVVDGSVILQNVELGGQNAADGNVAGPAGTAAPGNGGGLHVSGTNGTYTGVFESRVQNNFAAREGGGLWNQAGSELEVRDSVVADNTAAGDAADDGGGGIFNNGGNLDVADSVIVANVATGTAGSGGGIFSTAGNVFVDGSSISRNVANRAGGGVEIIDGSITFENSDLGGPLSADGNVAGPAGSAAPGNGGGLHVSGTNGTQTNLNNTTVRNNFAAREGGGLWNQAGSFMEILDSVIEDNVAAGDAADDGGGGIFNNGGNLHIMDSFVAANFASGASGSGGGIFSTDGDVFIDSSTIAQNVANRAGGGIEIVNGNITLVDSLLGGTSAADGNIAGPTGSASPGNGGGLHVSGTNDTQTVIDNTIVKNNLAANEGGGLWNQNGSQMTVVNGSFVGDNLAGVGGGGGILNRGRMTIMESSIIRNQTTGDGGGIKTTAGSASQMSDSEVSRNTSEGNGGGISNAGLFFTGNSSITYNQADLAGGGIFTAKMGQSKTVGTNFFGNSDINNP